MAKRKTNTWKIKWKLNMKEIKINDKITIQSKWKCKMENETWKMEITIWTWRMKDEQYKYKMESE